MQSLFLTISVTIIISAISLFGAILVSFKSETLRKFLPLTVALAAGTLIGDAFIHLIPESSEFLSVESVTTTALSAFILFFLLEKVLQWHHHHEYNHEKHTFGYMSLLGDSLHNFLDGLILYAAFQTGTTLGFATALAIILHEIPQEIGDFGVLLHSGFEKNKALLANLFVSFTALLGALIGFVWLNQVSNITPYITAFAAGGFLYTGAADLLPEIRKDTKNSNSIATFLVFIFGIFLIYFAG